MIAGHLTPRHELSRVQALLELQLLTGVKTSTWVGVPGESAYEQAERLEFLADVMLGIDEGEVTTPGEKAKAARVAELYRVVLGEPVDAPALLFRHAHGDPVDWTEADFETYENIARVDKMSAELKLFHAIGEIPALLSGDNTSGTRKVTAGVRAA